MGVRLPVFANLSIKTPALKALIAVTVVVASGVFFFQKEQMYRQQTAMLSQALVESEKQLSSVKEEFTTFQNQDQVKINRTLEAEVKSIHDTYLNAATTYESLLDLNVNQKNQMTKSFALSLKQLADKNYASAAATISLLNKSIEEEKAKQVTVTVPANVPSDNNPPSAGYRRQTVETSAGAFLVDIVSADLNNTRVVVDTASESDCVNDCPVLPLAAYASRSGAFAGINGSFFCPADYPSCAGKSNSFDTLLMNKNKRYFNSENNIYSVIPAVIFSGNSARFVTQSLQWGRDTGVDSVLANYPLLVLGGNAVFSGSGEAKLNSKGNRCFIGVKGSNVYIGVVHGASTSDEVVVLKTLGIQDALGLDQGGSTALWYNGSYKAGPGRNIPNAILFVRR